VDKNLKIALILSASDKASAVLGRAFANAERHSKSLERSGRAISNMGNQGLIAGGVMTAFFAKTVADARESEIAQKKLIQGFKTMGVEASMAQKAIDFAGAQQFVIGIDDEKIIDVQGKLGTFARTMSDLAIKNDIFNRATTATFDMQAKGFGDALSNANQLGKALQNPMLGASALAKSGTINKEDLPGIKLIQQTKGIAAAQVFLMNAVEKQVKGTAIAAADPLKVLQLELSETSEGIGRSLLPEVNKLARGVAGYIPKIISFVEKNKSLIVTVAKASAFLLLFSGGMKVLGFMISGVGTAFRIGGLLIKGFNTALIVGRNVALFAVKGYEALKFAMFAMQYTMKFSVLPALRMAGIAFMKFGAALLANPITWYIAAAVALAAVVWLVIKNWSKITAFFSKLWTGIKQTISTFWNWAKGIFLNFTPGGLIIKHWSKLSGMFTKIWDSVKKVFTDAWDWVMGLGARFYNAGKNIIKSIWQGMKDLAMKPVQVIANITSKIRKFLPFSPAKEGALKDIHKIKLVETIAQSITAKPLINAWGNATSKLYGQMNQPVPVFANNGSGQGSMNFNLTVNLSGGATQQDANNIFDTLKPRMDRWWKERQHESNRRGF
jgi:hypothetical protein